jgi:DNA segregation ATPase FtsK/SpoIIIE, S-DNA-T family
MRSAKTRAWLKEDGQREPERARAFHVTDADLVELGVYLAPAIVHEFPTSGEGRAAA